MWISFVSRPCPPKLVFQGGVVKGQEARCIYNFIYIYHIFLQIYSFAKHLYTTLASKNRDYLCPLSWQIAITYGFGQTGNWKAWSPNVIMVKDAIFGFDDDPSQ